MESGNCTIDSVNSASRLPRWIVVLTLFSCTVSMLGSLIQIITYCMCKQLRIPSRELLVYISVADLFSSLAIGVGTFKDFHKTTDWCIVQAFFSTFFSTSSMFWMVALLIYLFVTVVTINPERSASLILHFHIVCWGIPGFFSLLGKCTKCI